MFAWHWLADLCEHKAIPFTLGHALYMKAVHGGKAKNDRIDADIASCRDPEPDSCRPTVFPQRRNTGVPRSDLDDFERLGELKAPRTVARNCPGGISARSHNRDHLGQIGELLYFASEHSAVCHVVEEVLATTCRDCNELSRCLREKAKRPSPSARGNTRGPDPV